MRDKETGLVSPPTHPCYQDENKLCDLREFPDSRMDCAFDVKNGCGHSVIRKDEKKEAK